MLWLAAIFGCAQDLIPKKMDGKWGYINKAGDWIIKPKYDEAKDFKEDLAPVKSKGKWGFLFESGKWAIKPQFADVTNFSEGKAGAVSLKSSNGLWGFINKQGEWIIAESFSEVKQFSKGECVVKIPSLLPKQSFVIDEQGKQISPPYLKREKVKEGFHIVSQREDKSYLYCYTDKVGELISPWSLQDYELGKKQQIIKVSAEYENDQIPDNIITSNSTLFLFAFINESGEKVSKWYEEIREFSRGYAIAKRDHHFGFIDLSYNEITDFQFSEVRRLNDDYCVAQVSEESFALIDYKGVVISKEYHGFDIFDEDYLLGYEMEDFHGERRYKQALFDYSGNQKSGWYVKIYPKSSSFYRVIDGDYKTIKDGQQFETYYNYIVDSTGEVLSTWRKTHAIRIEVSQNNLKDSIYKFYHQPNTNYFIESTFFEDVFFMDIEINGDNFNFNGGDFYDGMAMVSEYKGKDTIVKTVKGITYHIPNVKYGFIDWSGHIIMPCKLDYTSGMSNGKAVFRTGDLYGVVNYKGKVSVKPSLKLVGNFGSGLAPCYADSAWKYINYLGKQALPQLFEEARPFKFGYAAVKLGNKWGLIDTRGNQVLPFKYKKAPEPIDRNRVRVLIDGVGYDIITL
ncbi:MAG: WG repeat-containing protein [Flavobacteriales bacterium]|nr:WG repeat-containing protein [Flavobacteriales bacterium]